jgi:hypothetical protein
MRVSFHHTHAYPGCSATVSGDRKASGQAIVEFSDGVVTAGQYRKVDGAIVLSVDPYVTSRRTPIERKRWKLVRAGAPGDLWKVAEKLPSSTSAAG